MRNRLPFLLPVLAALLAAPHADAGDEAEKPPIYGASDLAVEADALPEGWKLLDETPSTTPGDALEAWASGVAEGAGLDTGDLTFETRVLADADGNAATLLVVEVDGDAQGFPKALEAAAGAAGHAFRELGHRTRLLVVAAPKDLQPRLLALEVDVAVRTLTRLAHERLEAGSRIGAVRYAEGANAIAAGAAMPHVVLGLAALGDGNEEEALAHLKRAFAQDAPYAPAGRLALGGLGAYGLLLLGRKTEAANHEAKAILGQAVALEGEAGRNDAPHVNRYNLACALSLLGEKDAALTQLEKSLALAKERTPGDPYRAFVLHAMKDEDLAPLREEPRYKEILEKAMGGRAHGSSGM